MTLCGQEVVGTDESALDAVVAADAELMALRAEEAEIQQRLGAISLEDAPEVPSEAGTTAANDADNDRLAAIYDRLEVGSTTLWEHYRMLITAQAVHQALESMMDANLPGTWQCCAEYST